MNNHPPSIFNDVLGPVMRGPSSSHTAGAYRIGRLLRDLAGEQPNRVIFDFHQGGSLATTYHTQGSDMGLAAGLLGMEMTDPEMPRALDIAHEKRLNLEFHITEYQADHPNTYRCTIYQKDSSPITCTALSTGGGMIELIMINEKKVHIYGDETVILNINGQKRSLYPVMPVRKFTKTGLPFNSSQELLAHPEYPLLKTSDVARSYELLRSGESKIQLNRMMKELITIWRSAIDTGLLGTNYSDRLMGAQAPLFEQKRKSGRLIPAGPLNRMLAYSTAIMEVKSSMGVIVAAPTAGAAGGLPGCLFGLADEQNLPPDILPDAFWAAGLIGLFIGSEATFAAEVAGCQAETGAAGAMAAGGLVEIAGGNLQTAFNAASIALQNVMGLICDPVANRVEIPCLGRNALAAANALTAANLALGGVDPVIPFHETVKAMLEVGHSLPHTLRCTALGGLSMTPSAKRLEIQISQLNNKL